MAVLKIGKYKKTMLDLSSLELDPDNFRIGQQNNQSDTIKAMITRGSTKIAGIADSIAENGFLDLETLCVYPSKNGGKYIVAEGNRRITSLKAIQTPDLAQHTKLFSHFKQLHQKAGNKLPSKIECAVFEGKKDCWGYVLMRHGAQDGGGLLRWNSISKLRADEYVNKKNHAELRVIEFVLNKGSLTPAEQQQLDDDDFKITNLQRITDDKGIRPALGITGNNCVVSTHGETWLLPVWQRIVETIILSSHRGAKFTVDNNINTASDRKVFIDEILEDVHGIEPSPTPGGNGKGSSNNPSGGGSGAGKGKGNGSNSGTGKRGKPQPITKKRVGLIEKKFLPAKLKPQKVVDIVDELKKLSVDNFLNCSGVMFRVFFELSINNYMAEHQIRKTATVAVNKTITHITKELSLKDKTKAVITHLEANPKIDNKSLKALRDLLPNSHPLSAESMNAYVHSKTHTADAATLKNEWNNLQHIFDYLWEK